MSNHGCYVASLGNVCRWLANQADALGVEIYPGFPAADVLYDESGAVKGVVTADMGIARDGVTQARLPARHGVARKVHAVRGRRTRLALAAADGLVGVPNESIRMGMQVEVVFDDVTPEVTLPRFRPIG
jgi:flavin-dependent dehydrogenase